jgi:hypothetical protein
VTGRIIAFHLDAGVEVRLVSRRTCLAVLGVPPRAFDVLLADFVAAGGTVLRAGRLRLAEVAPLLGWMRDRERQATASTPAPTVPRDQGDDVDTLARELGLTAARVGGRR